MDCQGIPRIELALREDRSSPALGADVRVYGRIQNSSSNGCGICCKNSFYVQMLGHKMCSNVNKLPCAEGDPRCEGRSSYAHGRNLGSTLGMVEGEGAPRWLRRTSTDAGCASGVVCGSMGRWLDPYQFYQRQIRGDGIQSVQMAISTKFGAYDLCEGTRASSR